MYDVVIIGAGVSGASTARELSRYKARICVVEKCEDVCCGTSKANSAIVHGGFDAETGSLMARLNLRGNLMMDKLCDDLDIPFKRNGSLVVCTDPEKLGDLYALYDRGLANGVRGLEVITDRNRLLEMEPNLADGVCAALHAPTGGIINPFVMNIAMAENANENGVEFRFNTEIMDIEKCEGGFVLHSENGNIKTRCVVNAAGLYTDKFHNIFAEKKIKIIPRRGDYYLLDKTAGQYVSKTVFELPNKMGKGVIVTPTVDGNLLVGPTAIDVTDKEATNTTGEGLDIVLEKSKHTVKNIPMRQVITSFAGLRAHEQGHEFIIGELSEALGFFDCAAIESPGLTAAPAIGEMLADLIKKRLGLEEKDDFIATRKAVFDPSGLSEGERTKLIKEKPEYGTIVCRCEMISAGEIIEAIHRPLGAKTLDGIKRQVRAGSGRCQGGFCTPKVMEIIAKELNMEMCDLTKSGKESRIVLGRNKDWI
ncbi:MAG: NAD(P)/FAD-dependent oxidoreductase [Clostridiales bacterium]|nr:NAD(P)/FAD-dependent oxidoreductase [Clostridiales bacterium]